MTASDSINVANPRMKWRRIPWIKFLIILFVVVGIVVVIYQYYNDDYRKSKRDFDAAVSAGTLTVDQALNHRRIAGHEADSALYDPPFGHGRHYYQIEEQLALSHAIKLGDVRAALDLWFLSDYLPGFQDETMNLFQGAAKTHRDVDVVQGAYVALGQAHLKGVGVIKNDRTALSYLMNALTVPRGQDIYSRQLVSSLFTLYNEHACAAQAVVWTTLGANTDEARAAHQKAGSKEKLWAQETALWIEQQRTRGAPLKDLSDVLTRGGYCALHEGGSNPVSVSRSAAIAGT